MQPEVIYSGQPTGRRMPKWLIVIGVLVGLALAVYVTTLLTSNNDAAKSNSAAQKFAELVLQGDADTAYDTYASAEFKQSATKEEWAATVSRISPYLQGELQPVESSSQADVYRFTIENNPYLLTVETVIEDSQVKVKHFASSEVQQAE